MNMQNLAALAAIASNGNGGLSSLTGSGKKKNVIHALLLFSTHSYVGRSSFELLPLLSGLHSFIHDIARSAECWLFIDAFIYGYTKKERMKGGNSLHLLLYAYTFDSIGTVLKGKISHALFPTPDSTKKNS